MDLQNTEEKNEISELKELVEKNIKLSEEVLALSKKINGFMLWQRIFGVLKVVIIIIPLILSIIFLPPLLKDVFKSYQELLGLNDKIDLGNMKDANSSSILENIPASVRQYLE